MIYIDFETKSKIDIRKSGSWVYSLDPSTDILCLAYKIGNEAVKLWLPNESLPSDLILAINNNPVEAHNVFFEKSIWSNIAIKRYGFPEIKSHQWHCSMAKASYHNLPRNLSGATKALNLSQQKDDEGKKIMLQLAKPRRSGEFYDKGEYQDKYQILYDYCKQDVNAEYALSNYLSDLPPIEKRIWDLDQKINMAGINIDKETVQKSLIILQDYKNKLDIETKLITNNKINSVNQRAKIMEFAKDEGIILENYDRAYLSSIVKDIDNPKIKRLIQIRLEIGKTSTAKYQLMLDHADKDGVIRDNLLYFGTATGRFSGKNVQFHNLPRGDIEDIDLEIERIKNNDLSDIDNPMSFMSSAIRSMIIAPDDYRLACADFASIEVRVLAWLSDCKLALTQLRDNEDLYIQMASKVYSKKPEDITKEERQLGKAVILGCGYCMGVNKFQMICDNQNINIDHNLAEKSVYSYREIYKEIPNLWYELENTAKYTISNNKPISCSKITWQMKNNNLHCQLPSQRDIIYPNATIELTTTSWGEQRPQITYMIYKMGKWLKESTYGGKLAENITQAIARDIMANSMLNLDQKGYEIILTIHDEIIARVKKDSILSLNNFLKIMQIAPNWAKDIPLKVEGFMADRYKK